MGVTVEWLLANMSALELSYHAAIYGLEPFGPPADDVRFGVVAASLGGGNPGQFWPWNKPIATGGWQDLKAALRGVGKRERRSNPSASEGQ